MSRDRNELLQERLDQNYQDYLAQLREKPFEEIIKLAPEITAAQQLCDELAAVCREDEAEYLLGLDNPLEAVRDHWKRTISDFDHGEEMSHMLWHLRGCGRESPEAALMSKAKQSGFTQATTSQKPKIETPKSQKKKGKSAYER